MGDYYTGDYYRGDPFNPFGFVGRIAKGAIKLGGAASKLAFGVDVPKIVGKGVGLIKRPSGLAQKVKNVLASPTTAKIMAGAAGGGALVSVARPRGLGPMPMMNGFGPMEGAGVRGYHLAKDGSGRWVKNRQMNVTNPRALRRAIRRGRGFMKLARRVISFYSPKAPKGKIYFGKKAK